MPSSQDYKNMYEQYQPQLNEMLKYGNGSELGDQVNSAINYNKPILDAQANVLEDNRQILSQYRDSSNPEIAGLTMDQRQRLENYDTQGNRNEATKLGLIYSARTKGVADSIAKWQEGWNMRYKAAQEAQASAKTLYDMAMEQEKQAEQIRQFNATLAETKRANSMRSSGSGGSGSLTEAEKKALLANKLKASYTADRANPQAHYAFRREDQMNALASEFPEYKDYIFDVGYTIYKDNWEK
jgi:NADH dehydrogenase/NADH:ubiquinone oxidoreductase subunit G